MKKLYLFGNIKMNTDKDTLKNYFSELKTIANNSENIVGVAVPSVYIWYAQSQLQGSKVLWGSQNVHYENSGAYTGEISVPMLKDFDTKFCLVGHSERRTMFNETDVFVNKKIIQLLKNNITPILCVGETLQERELGQTQSVIFNQLAVALSSVSEQEFKNIIIAYEPVWAIGTGKSASATDAGAVIGYIKDVVNKLYESQLNDTVVLYGGSLNENNATELLSQKNIDGGLIGGACLDAKKFGAIIQTKAN